MPDNPRSRQLRRQVVRQLRALAGEPPQRLDVPSVAEHADPFLRQLAKTMLMAHWSTNR